MNNNQPNENELGLDNLEFFENFATEDPLGEESFDPNANLAPDILGGKTELTLEDDDLPTGKPAPKPEPVPVDPLRNNPLDDDAEPDNDDNEPEPDPIDTSDDTEEVNYYEAFGKGLLRSGHFDFCSQQRLSCKGRSCKGERFC